MDLLREVRYETGRELVFDVRRETNPLGSTAIPALDAHLQSTAGPSVPPGFPASVQRGDVFEIVGTGPKTGKTHLLYWLVMQSILPHDLAFSPALRGASVVRLRPEGWGKLAVVCDCDGRWDTKRLYTLLVARLARLAPEDAASYVPTLDELARTALERLVVFHLGESVSSAQLAGTLRALPDYLRRERPNEELGLLAVDSISSAHWHEPWRMDSDLHARDVYTSPFAQAVQSLASIRAPLTVVTNSSMFTAQHAPPPCPPISRALINGPLHVTHHIALTLGVTTLPKFPAGTSLLAAMRDTDRRVLVECGLIMARVRTVREPDVESRFAFEIRADEITLP